MRNNGHAWRSTIDWSINGWNSRKCFIEPQVAKINAKLQQVDNRIKFINSDVDKYNHDKYDLVVSNPPYILSRDIKTLSKEIVNFEPRIALDGGLDGLDLIKKVIYKSNHLLKKNGLLVIEIGFNQYRKTTCLLYTSDAADE